MSTRTASRREHDTFCRLEGWTAVRNARGQAVRHHLTYELRLPSGRVLRTRISRPANHDSYGPSLWAAILRDQLCVTQTEFWACLDAGVLPRREASPTLPVAALPAGLAYQLVHLVGLSDSAVAGMTRKEAVARMNEFWSQAP